MLRGWLVVFFGSMLSALLGGVRWWAWGDLDLALEPLESVAWGWGPFAAANLAGLLVLYELMLDRRDRHSSVTQVSVALGFVAAPAIGLATLGNVDPTSVTIAAIGVGFPAAWIGGAALMRRGAIRRQELHGPD